MGFGLVGVHGCLLSGTGCSLFCHSCVARAISIAVSTIIALMIIGIHLLGVYVVVFYEWVQAKCVCFYGRCSVCTTLCVLLLLVR